METIRRKILWLDCLGALVVGIVVMVFCRTLSHWEGLPLSVVASMGIANLTYGTYSLFVTTRRPRPLVFVTLLAVANMAWLIVCIAIASVWWNQITVLGLLHVLGEGIYVAGLGYTEWQMRDELVI